MPLLAGNTTESFGIQLGGTGTVSWVLSCISELAGGDGQNATVSRGVTAQGTAFAGGFRAIPNTFEPYKHGPATRELQFFSAINQGTGSNVVTLGKIVTQTVIETVPFLSTATTFFQFSPPALLNPGWSLIYVKEAGFFVYNADGVPVGPVAAGYTFSDGSTQDTSASPSNINACMVYNSQSQAVNAETSIQAAFDTVIDQNTSPANNGSPFWNSSNPTYLTIPEPGYYQVSCGYSITPSGGPGQTYLQIFKKGYPGGDEVCFAQQTQEQNQTSDNQSLNASAIIACVAGDQIYFIIGNSSSTNCSVFGGISTCYLNVALLAGGG